MNKEEQEYLRKIRKHLNELHIKWRNDPDSDGYCKSSEGYIGVTLNYPNWFEAKDYENDEPSISVSVYSYLFGPNRMHDYGSLKEAWEAVKEW